MIFLFFLKYDVLFFEKFQKIFVIIKNLLTIYINLLKKSFIIFITYKF